MIDDAVLAWFQAHRHPAVTWLMLVAAEVHGTTGLLIATALLAIVLWRRGEGAWIAVLAGVPAAMLLNVGIKHLVQRARPVVSEPLLHLSTYSFPSGHAAGATALYAFLAAWCLAHTRQPRLRFAVIAAAIGLSVWVDLSRVYLGVHYLSDVLAGSVLGVTCVLAALAAAGPRRLHPR
jgi:membrane-associated phospholipid phosphatase